MSEKLKITIKILPTGSFTMEYEDNDTVQYIKNLICQKPEFRETYDSRYIKLVCDGEVMENEKTMKDCEITENSNILLVKQKLGKIPPPKRKDLSFLTGRGLFDSLWSLDSMNDPFGISPFSRNRMLEPTIRPHNPRNQDAFLEAHGPRQRDPFAASMNSFGHNQFKAAGAHGFGGQFGASADGTSFQMNPTTFGNLETDISTKITTTDNEFKSTLSTEGASASFPAPTGSSFSAGGTSSFPMKPTFPSVSNSFTMPTLNKKKTSRKTEEKIKTLTDMGFTVKQSKKALKISDKHLQTAMDLLLAGSIPNDEPKLPEPPSIQDRRKAKGSIIKKPVANEPSPEVSSESDLEPDDDDDEAEGERPKYEPEQMRKFVQTLRNNPQQLQETKEMIKNANPQLAQMIDTNPEQFFNLLENQGSGGGSAGFGSGGARSNFGGAGHGLGSAGSESGQGASSLSGATASGMGQRSGFGNTNFRPSQDEVIARLESMGFERSKAIEAYNLCDRNEEMAVNYLLSL